MTDAQNTGTALDPSIVAYRRFMELEARVIADSADDEELEDISGAAFDAERAWLETPATTAEGALRKALHEKTWHSLESREVKIKGDGDLDDIATRAIISDATRILGDPPFTFVISDAEAASDLPPTPPALERSRAEVVRRGVDAILTGMPPDVVTELRRRVLSEAAA